MSAPTKRARRVAPLANEADDLDSRSGYHKALDRAAELDAEAKAADLAWIEQQRANPIVPVFKGPNGFHQALEASARLQAAEDATAREYEQRMRERHAEYEAGGAE